MLIHPRRRRHTQNPPFGSTLETSHPLARGLVGAWLFNEQGGQPVDLVSGRLATMSGSPTRSTDGGLVLNGTSQYVTCGRTYDFSNGFSVVARITRNGGTNPVIAAQIDSSDRGFYFRLTDNAGFRDTGGSYREISSADFAGRATVAFTYNKATLLNWRDGATISSGSFTTTPYSFGTFTIGRYGDVNTNHYGGEIEWLYVYTRGLSTAELQELRFDPFAFVNHPASRKIFVVSASGGTDATHNAPVQSVTSTIPAYSVSTSVNIAANVQTVTASTGVHGTRAGAGHDAAVQTLTFSIPAYTVETSGNVTVSANVLTLTASIPASTVSAGVNVQPAVQTLTASLPGSSVSAGVTISPAAQTLTANLISPSVNTGGSGTWDDNGNTWDGEPGTWDDNGTSPNVTVSANVLSLTAAIPAATISASSTILAGVQTITTAIPGITIPNETVFVPALSLLATVRSATVTGDLTVIVQPPALPDEVGRNAQNWQRSAGAKDFKRRTGRGPRNRSRFH
jgi:hypothetical protein